jgi:exodeoxyribonuclease V alpha subunit
MLLQTLYHFNMSYFDLSPAAFELPMASAIANIPTKNPSQNHLQSHLYLPVLASSDHGRLTHGQTVKLVGKLVRVKVLASGWGIGRINTDDFGDIGVNGNALAGLTEKLAYEFTGRVEENKSYGLQIKVDAVGLHVPASMAGIEKFLTQNYKGVGKKAAEKIVSYYARQAGGLSQFRLDLLANPYSMDFAIAGVKRKTSMDTADGLRSMIYMDIATKIGGVELGDKLLRKIAAYLEEPAKSSKNPIEKAWSILTSNPYALIRDMDGYAFKTADTVARKTGFDMKRPERTAALVTYAIAEGCNAAGHSYLTVADFNKIIHSIDANVNVTEAISAAMEMQEPMVIDNDKYYTEPCHKAEVFLAKNLFGRFNRPLRNQIHNGSKDEIMQEIDMAEAKIGLQLDSSQKVAVSGLLTSYSAIHTITADPGCGKTTIMELVVQILHGRTKLLHDPDTKKMVEVPYKIGFCAPTGKAAKVLNARVSRYGAKASTIHSLLGVRRMGETPAKESAGEGGSAAGADGAAGAGAGAGMGMFMHNHWNRLDVDLLVVDETSMVDLALMHALISAVPDMSHIVFLGDPKQLPSVGPGSCLADLLQMPFDHHVLTKTHRNDGGILEVVHMAGKGYIDFKPRKDVDFIDGLPAATETSISSVLEIYEDALDLCLGDFSRVGLLIARRKGDPTTPGWNSTYINTVLRERYNPEHRRMGGNVGSISGKAQSVLGEKIYGTRYRTGDRIIIRKNLTLEEGDDPDVAPEQVVNGDTGMIKDYLMEAGHLKQLEIKLDDGRTINLGSGETDSLDFSYAMTVHTAQGSEYDRIIFISVNGHSSFVHRGIVFTAFSRAKMHLTVVGDKDTVQTIIARPAPKRNSHLVQRLERQIDNNQIRHIQGRSF